jgi:hypothetical protein
MIARNLLIWIYATKTATSAAAVIVIFVWHFWPWSP